MSTTSHRQPAPDSATPADGRTSRWIEVWDPLVRTGHWLLVLGFFAAWLTEDELLSVHVWAGYLVGVVVMIRVLWGLVGPRHARFSDFVYAPGQVLAHLRALLALRSERYVGHSPAGGVMVLALLLSLSATVTTGLVVYALEENAGPLAGRVASAPGDTEHAFFPAARADDDEHERERTVDHEARGESWEEAHELFANLTLMLIGFHVAGVLLTSAVNRENLVRAMLTGRKRA
ncbi:MAG: cytochrome b/b6 domain-containing protein [Gammaproteobacteria bacterium]|nr:cytochrome b/b6 domain-containing protein [Gammaproteobacteria bacterium]